MANIIRSAKFGSDWTSNDLISYNITIRRQSSDSFFGYRPNTIPDAIDPDFLTATVPPDDYLSEATYKLFQYLDLATNLDSTQESAIEDFAKELLRFVGFEERGTILRSRYSIPFMICGDDRQSAQPGLCLVQSTTTVLLVIGEFSGRYPEAQVIGEAIAAFQYNNRIRSSYGLDPLDSMTIPAITMIGTHPIRGCQLRGCADKPSSDLRNGNS